LSTLGNIRTSYHQESGHWWNDSFITGRGKAT